MTPYADADIRRMDLTLLEDLVIRLATLYDQGLACVDFDGDDITDPHYDSLVRILKERHPESQAFAKGTNSPSQYDPSGDLVTHSPPMTSIDKADGDLATKKKKHVGWVTDCADELNYDLTKYDARHPLFVQTYKHDGVAIRIYYEKGKLVRAGLRPRLGVKGIDVTKNVLHVKGVPATLPLPLTLAIGGELECLLDDFFVVNKVLKAAGEKERENPRNHTYGGINQKTDPTKTRDARISFVGYNITGFDDADKYYKTEMERAKWVNTALKIPFVRVMPHHVERDPAGLIKDDCYQQLEEMEKNVPNLQYEVDGVVLKVNNLEDQEQLGHVGGDPTKEPNGALAWKFEEEHAVAKVKEIEYSASRTGRVPPVAIFEQPVRLAGTWVSRATLNNIGWMHRMQVGAGTEVKVIKAGKIIPKVIDVIAGQVADSPWPLYCPACNHGLKKVAGNPPNVDLICHNPGCPAKHISGIVFYLRTIEAKGLGEAAVEQILQTGKVRELADLYALTEADLTKVGFSDREAVLALATVHMVKPQKDNDKLRAAVQKAPKPQVQAWQFFAALGVPGAGKTAGKALIEHFGTFDKIVGADKDDLLAVPGIGDTTAEAIHDYMRANGDKVRRLAARIDLQYPKVGKLSGQTFCLSGSFDEGKIHWKNEIEDRGGKVTDSVSRTTSYLVAGPGSGSKSDKAKEYNVPILDVDGLKKLL